MKTLSIALLLLFTGAAYAQLTTEYPATNIVRINRNGALLLVTGQMSDGWMQHVYFKDRPVLMKVEGNKIKVFFDNSPVKVAETDRDNNGLADVVELYMINGPSKTIYDLLHIKPDGQLEPFSDQELQAEQEKWSIIKDSKQSGPAYPPQGVGSADP